MKALLYGAAIGAVALVVAGSDLASARGGPGRGGFGGAHAAAFGPSAFPHGFTRGRKTGWRGASVPPGWSHGRKTGWHGSSVPPGWRGP